MPRLTGKIQIGKWTLNGMTAIKTESSWEQMTDTATITIPKMIQWQGKPLVFSDNPILKKGNAVKIHLGFDERDALVFDGFLTNIHTKSPVELDCQDSMWQLKTGRFTKAYRSGKLSELLRDMLGKLNVPFEVVAEHDLGQIRYSNLTPAQVLDDLRKNYFVKCFFRNGVLYAGLAIVAKLQKVHKIRFDTHVPSDGNNLEYIRKEDVKIKLRVVIMKPDNKKDEFEVGDSDGEVRTFHKYNMPKDAARQLAELELERLKYDGYRGTLTIFGEPFIQHGDVVDLFDPENPNEAGQYLVKKVSREFGAGGYFQTLEIEGKANS